MASKETHRVTLRIPDDDFATLKYWAERRGVTINEYLIDSMYSQISRENGDYDLPKAEVIRLNQLQDMIAANSADLDNLKDIIISGFESLIGLTRGDNYLLEEDEDY